MARAVATAVPVERASVICGAAVIAAFATGLEILASAGFGDCLEQALTASNTPKIAKLAIIASFCWRDQDESVVPEIVLFVACFVFLLNDF
jgi:hypothetical protein